MMPYSGSLNTCSTQCSNLDIVQYDAVNLMGELGDGFKLLEEREESHITPANKEQKFTYYLIKQS